MAKAEREAAAAAARQAEMEIKASAAREEAARLAAESEAAQELEEAVRSAERAVAEAAAAEAAEADIDAQARLERDAAAEMSVEASGQGKEGEGRDHGKSVVPESESVTEVADAPLAQAPSAEALPRPTGPPPSGPDARVPMTIEDAFMNARPFAPIPDRPYSFSRFDHDPATFTETHANVSAYFEDRLVEALAEHGVAAEAEGVDAAVAERLRIAREADMSAARAAVSEHERARMDYERNSITWHLGMAATTALGAPEEAADLGQLEAPAFALPPLPVEAAAGAAGAKGAAAEEQEQRQAPPAPVVAATPAADETPLEDMDAPLPPLVAALGGDEHLGDNVPPSRAAGVGGWGAAEPLEHEATIDESIDVDATVEEIEFAPVEALESPR